MNERQKDSNLETQEYQHLLALEKKIQYEEGEMQKVRVPKFFWTILVITALLFLCVIVMAFCLKSIHILFMLILPCMIFLPFTTQYDDYRFKIRLHEMKLLTLNRQKEYGNDFEPLRDGLAQDLKNKIIFETSNQYSALALFIALLFFMIFINITTYYILYSVSNIQITSDITVSNILKVVPNLVFVMLPINIPLIWLAVVYNKKLNLSKKIIEEYEYKAIQIENISGIFKQFKQNDELKNERLLALIESILLDKPTSAMEKHNHSDHIAVEHCLKIMEKATNIASTSNK